MFAWNMNQCKIVREEAVDPAGQATEGRLFAVIRLEGAEKRAVVGTNDKLTAKQITFKVFNAPNDGKEFQFIGVPVPSML